MKVHRRKGGQSYHRPPINSSELLVAFAELVVFPLFVLRAQLNYKIIRCDVFKGFTVSLSEKGFIDSTVKIRGI